MAARTCRDCDLIYPNESEYNRCPACDQPTKFEPTRTLTTDWESRLARVLDTLHGNDTAAQKIILHRVGYLRRLDLPWELATELAARKRPDGSYQVDVHEIEKLIARGCSPLTAARILG